MMNHAPLLHALIMPAPDDFAIEDQNGTDWYAPLCSALFGFRNGCLEK
jgi:hypothetical protein